MFYTRNNSRRSVSKQAERRIALYRPYRRIQRIPSKGWREMKNSGLAVCAVMAVLLAAAPSISQGLDNHGQAVVTVLPKKAGAGPSVFNVQDLTLKVAGKDAKVTQWDIYKSPEDSLEVVLLFDDSSLNGLGTQRTEIEKFIDNLPPGVTAAVAYMEYGRAVLAGPLSADPAPTPARISASPTWPSTGLPKTPRRGARW
jgi:hypothetical protein